MSFNGSTMADMLHTVDLKPSVMHNWSWERGVRPLIIKKMREMYVHLSCKECIALREKFADAYHTVFAEWKLFLDRIGGISGLSWNRLGKSLKFLADDGVKQHADTSVEHHVEQFGGYSSMM